MALIFAGTFHHIGLACRSIEDEAAGISAFGYTAEGSTIDDPVQMVRAQFFVGAGPRIELIAPTTPESPVAGILKRGTKFYHMAYEVVDLDDAIHLLDQNGFRPVAPAAPAVAFEMRRIVFVMSKTGLLLELIEMRSVP